MKRAAPPPTVPALVLETWEGHSVDVAQGEAGAAALLFREGDVLPLVGAHGAHNPSVCVTLLVLERLALDADGAGDAESAQRWRATAEDVARGTTGWPRARLHTGPQPWEA